MVYLRNLVSRWKTNPIVDAIVACIVLGVIVATAYLAHDTRINTIAQQEALKAAQELSDRKWRQFFRANPDTIVPRRFFDRETIEEIEVENLSTPANSNLHPQKK